MGRSGKPDIDWGGSLAFDWAAHPDRVLGIAFLEGIVKPCHGRRRGCSVAWRGCDISAPALTRPTRR
jgi:hypothetical protein